MELLPTHVWPGLLLALVLLGDAILSLRPPRFISACLTGVGYPREWWWTLIVIKVLAVGGLVAGVWVSGIAVASHTGVIAYFICAAAAHVRARFFGPAFWVNCLGMLGLAVITPLLAFSPL